MIRSVISNNLRASSYRLTSEDLNNVSCHDLANFLLGKILARSINGKILKGRIVETECYLGVEDKASSSYGGRRTPTNEPMYMPPGTAYVYMTYGMYFCFNISSAGEGAAVLLRALEPLQGSDLMKSFRSGKKLKNPDRLKETELCNGPSKLCMSMNITKENCNKLDMCRSDEMWLEFDPDFSDDFKVVRTSRIGIDRVGGEWAVKPLRFYILNNPHVSKKDRKAEKEMENGQ